MIACQALAAALACAGAPPDEGPERARSAPGAADAGPPPAGAGAPDAGSGSVGAGMVPVPGGRFVMGSPPAEPGRDTDEGPQLEIGVGAFAADAAPVTAAEFESRLTEVAQRDPSVRWWTEATTPSTWIGRCNLGSARRDHPMNCVNWPAARAFCRLRGADLPTEAEWEYAARAGAGTAFGWGEAYDDARVVSSVACGARGCRGSTAPVVRSGPRCNRWSLCDLAGNVWEWTLTDYRDSLGPYVSAVPVDPPADPVHRGGGWLNHVATLYRSAHRGLAYPANGLTGVGFRCVRR